MKIEPPISSKRELIPVGEFDHVEVMFRDAAIEVSHTRMDKDGCVSGVSRMMFWPQEWERIAQSVLRVVDDNGLGVTDDKR